jgi:LPS export ABC transporter protein LptC
MVYFINTTKNLIICSCFLISFSCENEIERIQLVTYHEDFPDLHIKESVIKYTDSARLKIKIEAPVIKQFDLPEDSYTECPEGMHVFFYDPLGEVSSDIRSNYAIYYEEKKLWEARGNVVANNEKGETLNTEVLFWNQERGIIYSDEFTKITSEDGVYYGNKGFESDETFDRWELKGSSGEVQIKED